MTLPNNRKNDKAAIAKRRSTVAAMYVKGATQTEFAGRVGVTQATISTDLKAIQAEWRASTLRDFDAKKAEELAKLAHLESEAWAAWVRSQEDAVTTHKERESVREARHRKPRSAARRMVLSARQPGRPPRANPATHAFWTR